MRGESACARRSWSSYGRLSSSPGHAVDSRRSQNFYQQPSFNDLDPLVQGGFVVLVEDGNRLLSQDWSRVGSRVDKMNGATGHLTPYASAAGTACAPGNAGSNAGCVFTTRPGNRERNCGPRIFMKPADTTRSGSCATVASVIAASHASRSG